MTRRTCQTCKHYEPSSMWRKGWCRNPRLYAPHQSHLVEQDSLDCSRGLGSEWEAADAEDDPVEATASAERSPLRLFAPQPRLATAGVGMMASAGSGYGGGGTSGGGVPPPRPDRGGLPPGQERTVSYQPEERYWTDYLRIALPVIGLLLMLGLFWYWAAALIGDDDSGTEPTDVPQVALTEVNPPPATATATMVVTINPTPGAPPTATTAAGGPTPAQTQPLPTQPPTAGVFPVDSTVVTTEDGVRMRDQPSTEGGIVETLTAGTVLRITGPFAEAGDLDWYPVENVQTGLVGYVREDFLAAQ